MDITRSQIRNVFELEDPTSTVFYLSGVEGQGKFLMFYDNWTVYSCGTEKDGSRDGLLTYNLGNKLSKDLYAMSVRIKTYPTEKYYKDWWKDNIR